MYIASCSGYPRGLLFKAGGRTEWRQQRWCYLQIQQDVHDELGERAPMMTSAVHVLPAVLPGEYAPWITMPTLSNIVETDTLCAHIRCCMACAAAAWHAAGADCTGHAELHAALHGMVPTSQHIIFMFRVRSFSDAFSR
jgi:hypothetical protein